MSDKILIEIIKDKKKCRGFYRSSNEHEGLEGGFNPLECLAYLLINIELNRKDEQIGPIHATFELKGKSRQYGMPMEQLLKIYARSEKTDITFEYK